MKQAQLKTEWKENKISNSIYVSLYVNGLKTNIYYKKSGDDFFINSKEKAESEAELIKTGKIFPEDGNYENFDTCGTFYANLMDAKKVNFDYPNFLNKIYGRSGASYESEESQSNAMQEIKKETAHWSQWTKRIDKTNGSLLNNIGVKFWPNGYDVFFY